MKRKPKEAFGIVQDGLTIRIVHLRKDESDTYLMGLDGIELESDWYKADQVIAGSPNADFIPTEIQNLDINQYDVYETATQEERESTLPTTNAKPTTVLLSKFNFQNGVIALNIHEEHIIKDTSGKVDKKDIVKFRKEKLTKLQMKSGEWSSCIVEAAGQKQHWLYTGPNMLLHTLQDYATEAHTKLYYQLADANDLILTDFFRYTQNIEEGKTVLLVYLGIEYRKMFLFQDGKWINTFPLQITQSRPEPEVINSKIALALDSAQIAEPDEIVLTGDWASRELCDYMNTQNISVQVKLLHFPNLTIAHTGDNELNEEVISPYALAIAVAYKALNYDNPVFSKCNFLPAKLLEEQKELKVVWHGFIVLTLIFGVVMYSTIHYLTLNRSISNYKRANQEMEFTFNRLKAENAILEQIRSEIESYKENINRIGTILQGKNRWTEMFNVLNTGFASQPSSWISNLKKADKEDRIVITGTTTRRENIAKIANSLPNSRISKVTNADIRKKKVWNFEMDFDLPEVDWVHDIENEFIQENPEVVERIIAKPKSKSKSVRTSVKPVITNGTLSKAVSTKSNGIGINYNYGVLPLINSDYLPQPIGNELANNRKLASEYQNFLSSINKVNMLEYRFLGQKILAKYEDSSILPLIRWWIAYRLYCDKDYRTASMYLEPNLRTRDYYYPYSVLLQARIDFASENDRFQQLYDSIISQYPDSDVYKQASIDLKYIREGVLR
ncbi:MAG TPA: hypothetical protein P5518_05735 [Candidatus Cloacimonas sp.]|jgi:aspartate carbamoyltransferase regulatory subunit|nr:hypothetical protein [Candidatus Cloacimonas sp.]MCK9165479.1 hypothetical protein [Candidatus Cloacimonas sp.]MDD3733495.1 hypothetical protein [Candidatus Cloacimonadota bacterium]OQC06725.1 MAG: hypothetical protein BWX76_00319 [Candidatus Cloacimonetes bacterium ADurb.Bin089]HRR00806.1 hypothetical protein [Candidatus Cloacimonas sp.]